MREFFERLSRHASTAGQRPAIVSADTALSYASLYAQVRAKAQTAARLPRRIGLLMAKGTECIICDLALSFAGKKVVPLPEFFSDAQLLHIIKAARLSEVVTDYASTERARRLGLIVHELSAAAVPGDPPANQTSRIIFTSGTTGKPKGVCLSGSQLLASVDALAEASLAGANDRYLSVLPSSLLLEQVAGMYLPLSVGAAIVVPRIPAASAGSQLALEAERTGVTATVLVPELLLAWLQELRSVSRSGPKSLRFIAVGGAPVSRQLAAAAWAQGLPVYEGYGLSECCSVVSVNRPDARRAGTAGRPLRNVAVTIDDGEVVVSGPTVMSGYVGEPPISGSWRTGDLGELSADGFLRVSGRKDNIIVTTGGRNISPEWIEEVIGADSRIKRCVVVAHGRQLGALIIPNNSSVCGDIPAMQELLASAVRELPEYAQPQCYLAMSDQEFRRLDLLTANQRPRRSEISLVFNRTETFAFQPL